MIKLGYMNLQVQADYVRLAELLNLEISFVYDKENRNKLIIDIIDLDEDVGFPYTFPFIFGETDRSIFECLVTKQKPVTREIEFTTNGGFYIDGDNKFYVDGEGSKYFTG